MTHDLKIVYWVPDKVEGHLICDLWIGPASGTAVRVKATVTRASQLHQVLGRSSSKGQALIGRSTKCSPLSMGGEVGVRG
jgi:hypothetical protein